MIFVICIFCAVIAVQSILHLCERRDLYNRIMSRDFSEYKGEKCGYTQSAHDRVLKRWRKKGGDIK